MPGAQNKTPAPESGVGDKKDVDENRQIISASQSTRCTSTPDHTPFIRAAKEPTKNLLQAGISWNFAPIYESKSYAVRSILILQF